MTHDPLGQLNLHHLRALDVLLQERSVSRTAARLGLTPSAVSHALRGLREVLEDPLLVRGTGGMVPTPRAQALALPLRRALHDLSTALLESPSFEAAASDRRFRLAMPDSIAFLVLPALLSRVRQEAPGVDLEIFPVGNRRLSEAMETGDVDLAVALGTLPTQGLVAQELGTGGFACVVRRGHPALQDGALDLEAYCTWPHALLSPAGRGPGIVDRALADLGRERRVQLRIRYFLAAPQLIAGTDLVLTGPAVLLEDFARQEGLVLFAPPLPLGTFATSMVWHERNAEDPAVTWLRGLIVEAAQGRV